MALSTPAVDLPTQEKSGIKIKTEKEDDGYTQEEKKSNSRPLNQFIVNDPQLSRLQSRNITITVADSPEKEAVARSHPSERAAQKKVAPPLPKVEPPPIDHSSICGAFAWTTIGPVHLPVIMRGDDKFIAIRMFEIKIVCGYFPDIFPASIFSCTNITSYYVTEHEAILLNEINSFHCDYQFTYNDFSTKDYIIRLGDAVSLFEFLEFCRSKLYNQSSNYLCSDKCGYFLNYKIPYIKKGTKKYISLGSVYPEEVTPPVHNSETITNWDLAYFKFLSCFATIDLRKLAVDLPLCNVEDLEIAVGVCFEEVSNWPEIRFTSKEEWQNFLYPRTLQWVSGTTQLPPDLLDDSLRLRKKLSEIDDKETTLNSFLGLNKFLEMNMPVPRMPQVRNHDSVSGLNILQGTDNSSSFPVNIDNFLSTTSCNYPYPVSYNHYNNHIQTPSVLEYDRYRKSEESLPSLSSRKPRSIPKPPPLVPLPNPRMNPASTDQVPKPSSLYPYLPPPSTAPCPPWLARIFEPGWLNEEDSRLISQPNETPENLSRRLSETDAWCSTSLSSGMDLTGAGSSSAACSSSNIGASFDLVSPLCREDRMLHAPGGSPRLLAGPGPPPHYPTPPQSSPLQPMSLLDCSTMPGFTDMYATRLTPNGLADMCSPPPSPEMRTTLSGSPRGTHYAYQPHMIRMVQLDSRLLMAINMEPMKHASHLAVPIADVVNKFLAGTNVQSCQFMLESAFGLHLYDCTSLQQETFAKHNFKIAAGSKLVLVTDLRNCLYQLKCLQVGQDKHNERQCSMDMASPSDMPLSKRWCGNAREC